MKVLAIDPGYGRIGIAVLERTKSRAEELLYSNCLETSLHDPFPDRLRVIGEEMARILALYTPDSLAIETLLFNTNQKTALLVSEARGVIIYEARRCGLSVSEYTPLQVKIALTGYGRGTKEQLAAMVKRLVVIDKEIRRDDEYDAIAIGLTHLATRPR